MPESTLTGASTQIDTSADTIVCALHLEGIPGGRTLDVSGFTVDGAAAEVAKGGHLIIEETATGVLKPLSIDAETTGTTPTPRQYSALPAGHTYKGVLYGTILTKDPRAAVLVRGRVNTEAAVQAQGLPAYPTAAVDALPLIRFTKD